MCGWRDDYGRDKLSKLGDRELIRVYRSEMPSPNGKSREELVDMICERRRDRAKAKGDYRRKYQSLVPQVKRLENRLATAEEKVSELKRSLKRAEVERRHAVELAGALLRRMDKMEVDHMEYDTDLYAPLADDDDPLACMVRFGCDDDEEEDEADER